MSSHLSIVPFSLTQVVWHKQEESLTNLHCGREYHVYLVLFNAFGASPASQVGTASLDLYVHFQMLAPLIQWIQCCIIGYE